MYGFNRLKNGIIGFIIGDTMGVPLEFNKRRNEDNKIIDMLEYSSHNKPKGYWSDDSSMVIATMKAIIDNKGKIYYESIMNNFIKWAEKGEFTPNGKVFGIGRTTLRALYNYKLNNMKAVNCGLDSINDNGNGSLMRILPIAYYCYYKKLDDKDIYNLVKEISSMTHRHSISILGCYIYVLFVVNILNGEKKELAYRNVKEYDYKKYFSLDSIKYYDRLLNDDISKLDIDSISSMGFVVDTLEAVIWCFMNSKSYSESIIKAINLGNDSDTIGALVGGVSGIYYNEINNKWLSDIKRKDYLLDLCDKYSKILDV